MRHQSQRSLYLFVLCLLCLSLLVSCSSNTMLPAANSKTAELTITLPGTISSTVSVNEEGKLLKSAQIISSDGKIGLSIDEDTALLDKDGKPLNSITVAIDPLIPLPPEDAEMVGSIFDIQPQGATAIPSLKLTLKYDPSLLLQGFNENNLWIYEYTGDTWNLIRYKQVDTADNRVTTRITNFGKYSVFASMKPVEVTATASQQSLTSIPLPEALINGNPTLAEFGRGTCVPCMQMKPILENLAVEYQNRLNVPIVSVDEYRDLTNYYKIMTIPTQICFDSSGKEVFRHIGFWQKDQIVAQLKKLGLIQ